MPTLIKLVTKTMMCSFFRLALLVLFIEIADRAMAFEEPGTNVATDHNSRLAWKTSNFRHIRADVGCTDCDVDNYYRSRTKRGIIVNPAVFKGYKAAKYLLRGAQPVQKGEKLLRDKVNEFQKLGGYQRAHTEFLALQPSNIRIAGPPGHRTMMGNVGDRTLILNEKGFADMPQLDIIKDQSGPEISIIYYRALP